MSKPTFETVVADHGPTVLRVCLAVLGRSEADDAWSETFLSALRAYPELPDDANVEAWLVTIAHRKAIDVTRAAARRAIPVERLPDQAGSNTAASNPAASNTAASNAADARDLDLVAAIGRLPPKQKQAVAYHYLAGLPYADVAAILGGNTDSARRAGADGIATLRRTYPRFAESSTATTGEA